MSRTPGVVLALLLVLAVESSCLLIPWARKRILWERNPIERGESLARANGCFACHGAGGHGGVHNPDSDDQDVPTLDGGEMAHYVKNEQELFEYVKYGVPERLRKDASHQASVRKAAIHMPAYEGVLRDADISDIVSFILANNVVPSPPKSLAREYAGQNLVFEKGCVGCHGPLGGGGAPNPGSFKGYVPGWRGSDYEELVADDAELKEWIDTGESRRIKALPLGATFLKRQIIKMPAFEKHMTAEERQQVVAYLKWLHAQPTEWRPGIHFPGATPTTETQGGME